jgi:hypothetical protein
MIGSSGAVAVSGARHFGVGYLPDDRQTGLEINNGIVRLKNYETVMIRSGKNKGCGPKNVRIN